MTNTNSVNVIIRGSPNKLILMDMEESIIMQHMYFVKMYEICDFLAKFVHIVFVFVAVLFVFGTSIFFVNYYFWLFVDDLFSHSTPPEGYGMWIFFGVFFWLSESRNFLRQIENTYFSNCCDGLICQMDVDERLTKV